MLFFPRVSAPGLTRRLLECFGGYHRAPRIEEGEFYDMQNLTSDEYPMLAVRAPRGYVRTLAEPCGLLGGERLVWVEGKTVYYDHAAVPGLELSDEDWMYPKYMVRMGAYVCIFPDKLYFNTAEPSDCGAMEARFAAQYATVEYALCKRNGERYASEPLVSAQAPQSPENGALWIDSSERPHTLRQYSDAAGTWVSIPTTYVRVSCPGIGAQFQPYDGVHIAGLAPPPEPQHWRPDDLPNGERIIYACGENYIVLTGMIDELYTAQSDTLSVERLVPEMDYVIECENRLWGCKYGRVDGEPRNELYCCALGDFKNWSQFLGLSTDSWRASCGAQGAFTGAVSFGGNPIFFKSNTIYKIFPAADGAHSLTQSVCPGANDRMERNSLAIVGSSLFYLSDSGVMAYDGTLPRCVGQALGPQRYYARCAAAVGQKYYLCVYDERYKNHLFVFDTQCGLWHKEDCPELNWMVCAENEIFAIEERAGQGLLHCLTNAAYRRVTQPEEAVAWSASSGLIGYRSAEQKYVSRFSLRMTLPPGSHADLFLEYDSSGLWEHAGHLCGKGTGSFLVPVRPRRCDHFRWRLTGRGAARVYSIAKYFEQGSDEV